MFRGAPRARYVVIAICALFLSACGGTAGFSSDPPTIYDLTQRPNEFAGKEVTATGVYLWRPGDPGMSVLLPGVHTAPDSVLDAQPIYASVECDAAGNCKPSKTQVGTANTGAVWLENFPADVTTDLHRPGDAVWGDVQVTGTFENAGGYGPGGEYRYRMLVTSAKPLQKVERLVSAVENKPLGDGKVTIFELTDNPDQYNGQQVTTQGYYFWSPATQGMFVEKVEREKNGDDEAGLAPLPAGRTMGLDGFPAELSSQLNVGPNGTFVWGLVEVTGTIQTGTFGPNGAYKQQIKLDGSQSVKVLEQPQQ